MDKIFRRSTQLSNTPKKKKDEHARKRNQIINFRVSPEEKMLIEKRIAMSGLSRSEFFIQSCLYQKILVKGNVKTFDAIRKEIRSVGGRLEEMIEGEPIAEVDLMGTRTILEMLNSIFGNNKTEKRGI